MTICLAIALSTFQPANYVADQCALAHQALDQGSVSVDVKTMGIYSKESTSYDLRYDRKGSADLTIFRKKPFRVVVAGDKVVEFDQSTNQYSDKAKGPEDFDATVRHSAGVLDELVASLMSPNGIRLWLKSLRVSNLWKVSSEPGTLVLANDMPESHTRIVLDSTTHLLKRVETKANSYGTEWQFRFRPATSVIAFNPPKGANKVKELMPEIGEPAYASAQAKKACHKVFARYDHPSGIGYEVDSGDEKHQVWIDAGRARQRDTKADWLIDGKTFSIAINATQTFATGTTDMTKVVDAVNASGTRIDPLLKLLLRGINPFRFYFGQNTTVKVVGTTKFEGEACTMLEASSMNSHLSLVSRNRDGFVLSLMSIQNGSDATSTRQFRPLPVTENEFRLAQPSGWTSRSVNEIAALSNQP